MTGRNLFKIGKYVINALAKMLKITPPLFPQIPYVLIQRHKGETGNAIKIYFT